MKASRCSPVILIALLFAYAAYSGAAVPEVELLTDGDQLSPASTVELRFARDMVKAEQLGAAVTPSPVVTNPSLNGDFVWLSRRSGIFTPKEEPKMGVTYSLGLLSGLADTSGKAIGAGFSAKLKTPEFGVVLGLAEGASDRQTQPAAEEKIAFNREVKLEGAEGLFRFVHDDGQAIPAKIRYATSRDYIRLDPASEPWELRWQRAQGKGKAAPPRTEEDDDSAPEVPRMNCFIVEPSSLLTPGGVWRLEMKPGVESLTGGYNVPKGRRSILGTVLPFTVEKVSTSAYLNSGRSVELRFTRDLGQDVGESTAQRYFKVTPEVKNLRFETGYQSITVRGDFERDADYELTLSENLHDGAGLPFSGERVQKFRIGAVKPRVYLPTITGHQMANGVRRLPITTINMQRLHVSARLVAPEDAARALRGFAQYQKESSGDEDNEVYQAVAPKAIPSKPLYDRTLQLPSPTLDAHQETLLNWTEVLGGTRPGMVFLTVEGEPMAGVSGKRAGAQMLVQLTDLGVLWKKVDRQIQFSVFSMTTGQPVPGAEVNLKNEKWQAVSGRRTDAAGAVSLPVAKDLAWVTVRQGADSHTMTMGQNATDLPMSAFQLPIFYDDWWNDGWETKKPVRPTLRALLFTDRPLYHLGETAHLKGVVRVVDAKGLGFFARQKGEIILSLPNDRGQRSLPVQTDERGAFDVDLPLDANVAGTYRASLVVGGKASQDEEEEESPSGGEGFSTTFIAGDYQPNAFEVRIGIPKRLPPAQVAAPEISGRYYFGAALGAAKVRWTLQENWADSGSEGFEAFHFGPAELPEHKSLTLRGEEELPKTGGVTLHPRLPEAQGAPRRGRLTVEVTNENQQTVAESSEYFRDSSSFYLGLKSTEGSVVGHEESVGAHVIAIRPDGTPLPEPIAVKTELLRVTYDTVRAQTAGPAVSYQTTRHEEVVQSIDGRSQVPVRTGGEWTLSPGEAARFHPGKAGAYLLRASAVDDGGRAVLAESEFNVSGSEPVAWDYRNPAQVELIADKAEYHPGDTAKLMIKTPIAGEARVSVEREAQVLRTLRAKLEGNAPVIEIPLLPGDAPNVFVSMVLIRGAEQSTHRTKQPEYRYGICKLHVTNPATHLAVQITPRAAKLQPGEDVAAEILVREADGKPAANAEVTFLAADNGVLAITGYERPKPHEVFEKPFPLKIRTGISLFDLLYDPATADSLDAVAEAALGNKGYLIGGGGQGGPGPRLRSDFPGTAAWEPKLRTNQAGTVTVHFRAPDALTSYRLVAFAHLGTDRFGTAETNVEISKKFMLLSGLGQFGHNGDTLIARAVVRNESGAAGTADVGLELDRKAEPIGGPLTRKVEVPSGESRTVDFEVRLRENGPAHWKWSGELKTESGAFTDALAAPMLIVPPAPILRETYLPELRAAQNDLLEGVNPQLLEGRGDVRVTLSNTRLASLRDSTEALLEYPYGCAEQTISSMLPWIVARDFGPIMPELADAAAGQRALQAGLTKLHGMQTERGGIAYWPGGLRPSIFCSAYAAMVLGMLEKQADASADPDSAVTDTELQGQLLDFLSKSLRGLGATQAKDQPGIEGLGDYALACYALALSGHPEASYHELLFARRAKMPYEARALLAAAILESKGSTATVAKLLDPRETADPCTCWFGSATRERAIGLLAWTRFKKDDREVGRLVKEILAARVNGHWRTTQENAWALLGLAQYFARVEREVKPVQGTLSHADRATPFALTTKDLTTTKEFAFERNALGALGVSNPKKAALYGEVKFSVEPPVALQPRQNRGFDVSRQYFKVDDAGALSEAKEWQVGDRAVVLLRIQTTVPTHFVAIDDPLPAIFEAVNPEFRSQEVGGVANPAFDWASDYREIRADRVLYFCDHLPAGSYTFRYLARVRSAGKVIAPSTKVEEMYRPEQFGFGASETLEARAR